ncbi:XF1762 family protein [Streptomyces diastaticus]|uniref:XF1762 family protein n=1 Tax=Streptomyces diastaticus TaxID=1956 RepID=UPI00365663F0
MLHLVPVRSRQAKEFVRTWHRHHPPPAGQIFAVGAADETGVLRAVAIVGRPVARHLDDGATLEVTRTVSDGTRNANSLLYGASWRAAKALGYRRLITFTQEGESGASLRGAGWHLIARRPPRAGWHTASSRSCGKSPDPAPLRSPTRLEDLAVPASPPNFRRSPRAPLGTMTFLDLPDVFVGSTDDGHTFVLLNRRIRSADRTLTEAGFHRQDHPGRTLYLLPPGLPEEANERAGIATYGLLAHTHDLVDLSWTTRWDPDRPASAADLHVQFVNGTVALTPRSTAARSLLSQHVDLAPAADGSFRPQTGLDQRRQLGVVTAVETHAYTHSLKVQIDLGIPTPSEIPAGARHRTQTATAPACRPPPRRVAALAERRERRSRTLLTRTPLPSPHAFRHPQRT